MEEISKAQKQVFERLQEAKVRNKNALFAAEGLKCIQDLLKFGAKAKWLAYSKPELWRSFELPESAKETPVFDAQAYPKLSHLATPSGLFGVFYQMPFGASHELKHVPTLILDGIKDPGNLGTMLRTAHWFGLNQVILTKGCVDPYNPKTVQSTMGSLVALSLFRLTHEELVEALLNLSLKPIALSLEGNPLPADASIQSKALIVGSESHGVSAELLRISEAWYLPAANPLNAPDSLNAAVSLAAVLGRMLL